MPNHAFTLENQPDMTLYDMLLTDKSHNARPLLNS